MEDFLVIGESQSFQYQITNNEMSNHYNHLQLNKYNQKLLKRGSIIYLKHEYKIEQEIQVGHFTLYIISSC